MKTVKNQRKRILNVSREKKMITYKGTPIRLSVDFSAETPQARKEWNDIVKMLKKKLPAKNTLYGSYSSDRKEK